MKYWLKSIKSKNWFSKSSYEYLRSTCRILFCVLHKLGEGYPKWIIQMGLGEYKGKSTIHIICCVQFLNVYQICISKIAMHIRKILQNVFHIVQHDFCKMQPFSTKYNVFTIWNALSSRWRISSEFSNT